MQDRALQAKGELPFIYSLFEHYNVSHACITCIMHWSISRSTLRRTKQKLTRNDIMIIQHTTHPPNPTVMPSRRFNIYGYFCTTTLCDIHRSKSKRICKHIPLQFNAKLDGGYFFSPPPFRILRIKGKVSLIIIIIKLGKDNEGKCILPHVKQNC